MSPAALLDVRPFEHAEEYAHMVDYFVDGADAFLRGMGVDPDRLPDRADWLATCLADHARADRDKQRLYLAWRVDGELVGHSSASHIEVGVSCHVHLHLWRPDLRRGGLGRELFRRSIGIAFERLDLQRVVCEPFAHNPGPNRTLEHLGFRWLRRQRCVPTGIAYEQDVNTWELTRSAWRRRRDGVTLD